MGKKGSVLLHVMVSGVIFALIIAMLLRMALMRQQETYRATQQNSHRRQAEAALARMTSAWNDPTRCFRGTCTCTTVPGLTCAGCGADNTQTCGCSYQDTLDNIQTIQTGNDPVRNTATNCLVTVKTNDN